jgi:hypothetical protein
MFRLAHGHFVVAGRWLLHRVVSRALRGIFDWRVGSGLLGLRRFAGT